MELRTLARWEIHQRLIPIALLKCRSGIEIQALKTRVASVVSCAY